MKAKDESDKKKKVTPHLWNLNEDHSLSGMIIHFIEPGGGNKRKMVIIFI